MGMSHEQWLASLPALTPGNELVFAAWRFCGGWNPTLVPAAAAYYGIEDIDCLLSQLLAMRDLIEQHRAAQAAAIKGGA